VAWGISTGGPEAREGNGRFRGIIRTCTGGYNIGYGANRKPRIGVFS
jgi:hypothetical protein